MAGTDDSYYEYISPQKATIARLTADNQRLWQANLDLQRKRDAAVARADLCGPAAQGWQPIETAPKDGTRFLGYTWDGVIKQGYLSERYMHADHCTSIQTYTHWMPLPAPPQPSAALAVLQDPVSVHLNMLTGKIAKPSLAQIIHLYGEDALRAAIDAAKP